MSSRKAFLPFSLSFKLARLALGRPPTRSPNPISLEIDGRSGAVAEWSRKCKIFRFYTQDVILSKGYKPFSLSFSDSPCSSRKCKIFRFYTQDDGTTISFSKLFYLDLDHMEIILLLLYLLLVF